jgi:ABC-type transporter MlaC component
MNKLINAMAKVMNAILDNGISIAKKKNNHWNEFINEEGF